MVRLKVSAMTVPCGILLISLALVLGEPTATISPQRFVLQPRDPFLTATCQGNQTKMAANMWGIHYCTWKDSRGTEFATAPDRCRGPACRSTRCTVDGLLVIRPGKIHCTVHFDNRSNATAVLDVELANTTDSKDWESVLEKLEKLG